MTLQMVICFPSVFYRYIIFKNISKIFETGLNEFIKQTQQVLKQVYIEGYNAASLAINQAFISNIFLKNAHKN